MQTQSPDQRPYLLLSLDNLVTVASNGRQVCKQYFISSGWLRNLIALQIKNLVSLAHSLETVGKVSGGFCHLQPVMKASGLGVPGHVESNINTVDDRSKGLVG